MKIYDISAVITEDMTIYSDEEKIHITDIYQIKNGSPVNMKRINFTGHTGSHADVPLHFIDAGMTCEDIPLDHFYGRARLVQMPHLSGNISREDLLPLYILPGDILLLNTGRKALLPDAAAYLAEKEIKTIGLDSLSVDPFDSTDFPSHHILLGHGISILEGLVLDGVPQGLYELSALPLKIKNGDGSPVRAILADHHKTELVIFDMDGLIVDTESVSKVSWERALEHFGFGKMPEEVFTMLLGRSANANRRFLTAHYGPGFDFDAVHKLRLENMSSHFAVHGCVPKKGLTRILDHLDKMGIKKCVATSSERDVMEDRLKGLLHRFDGFVTADQVKHSKPDPTIFLKAAKLFGAAPANCVVLEDSNAGITAAAAAGMRPMMIPDMAGPDAASLARIYAQPRDLSEAAKLISVD